MREWNSKHKSGNPPELFGAVESVDGKCSVVDKCSCCSCLSLADYIFAVDCTYFVDYNCWCYSCSCWPFVRSVVLVLGSLACTMLGTLYRFQRALPTILNSKHMQHKFMLKKTNPDIQVSAQPKSK